MFMKHKLLLQALTFFFSFYFYMKNDCQLSITASLYILWYRCHAQSCRRSVKFASLLCCICILL